MSTLSCLALIIYMEARGEPQESQRLVASVALERAEHEGVPLCKSMKKKGAYSWMWDGVSTKIDKEELRKKFFPVAKEVLVRQSLKGRLYFNNCKLGKRWKSEYKMLKVGKLCFY